MNVLILAGGKGTRLRSVVQDVPKPMADISGTPFLQYLLDHVIDCGASRIILSVGYLYQVITGYFKHSYRGIPIHYIIEDEPLGTGGAMLKAVKQVPDAGIVVTMNGDSLLLCDLAEMVHHLRDNVDLVMAVKYMPNTGRYGNVLLDNEKAAVDGFGEKRSDSDGYINGGIYAFRPELFEKFALPPVFSFESSILEQHHSDLTIRAFITDGYFIDIGIAEDYARAQTELPKLF